MVTELKIGNTCLRKMSYAFVNYDDLCDEVATLKAEIVQMDVDDYLANITVLGIRTWQ